MFGEGISKMGELIDVGVKLGIVQKSGAWFNYGDIRLGQGRDSAKQFLKDNPEIANDIEGQIAPAQTKLRHRRPAKTEALPLRQRRKRAARPLLPQGACRQGPGRSRRAGTSWWRTKCQLFEKSHPLAEEEVPTPPRPAPRAMELLAGQELSSGQLYERLGQGFTQPTAAAVVAEMVGGDMDDERYA